MAERVDAVVIGLGPGGEEVAARLAEAGMRVVGVESELLGGECPYWACVPTKMMVRATGMLAEARRIDGVAGHAEVAPDWAPVARRIRSEATDGWDDRVAVERFEGKGGVFVRGAARLTGPRTVEVGGRAFEAARAVVIATGTRPSIPPVEGLGDVPFWTNREAVAATEVPDSIAVMGGGAVGAEFSQVLARAGSRVTVVEADRRLLPLEEPEAGRLLAEVFAREGITVRTGSQVRRVSGGDDGVHLELDGGAGVTAARLLVATGRRPRIDDLGLESAGLDGSARAIEVDGRMRAGEGLWAVGDVTGKGAFTHVAMYQARIAAEDILGRDPAPAEYHALPRVTFTDPEVGSVGLSEARATEQGLEVRTGTAQVPSTARGWIHGPGNDGFIKLVEDRRAGTLVGATSAGPWGGEVLSFLAVAVHARVPTSTLREMIYAYPTFHRGIEDALRELAAR